MHESLSCDCSISLQPSVSFAATSLFRLFDKYRPETKAEKAKRLRTQAEAQAKGGAKQEKSKRPNVVRHGVNSVTTLVEQKRAKLVAIASDVEPIEVRSFPTAQFKLSFLLKDRLILTILCDQNVLL